MDNAQMAQLIVVNPPLYVVKDLNFAEYRIKTFGRDTPHLIN